MKKILFVIAIICLISGWASQLDDPLSEEALSYIQRESSHVQSQAFLYLFGFATQPPNDPLEVGDARLAAYQSGQAVQAQVDDSIALPEGPLFCRFYEPDCLSSLFAEADNIQDVVQQHAVLLNRLETFVQFTEFSTLTKASLDEPFAPYRYLLHAQRIRLLSVILLLDQGDVDAALEQLYLQQQQLRDLLRLQDNLIGKMTLLAAISDVIDVLALTLNQYQTSPRTFIVLPALNAEEKSFARIAHRQFMGSYRLFMSLDGNPHFFHENEPSPAFYIRALYKPHMTINAEVATFKRLAWLAQLDLPDLAKALDAGSLSEPLSEQLSEPSLQFAVKKTPTFIDKLRNVAGNALLSVSRNDDNYIARMADLDAKIALFNQAFSQAAWPKRMINPYYAVSEDITLDDGRLCFQGPLADDKYIRCIIMEIKQ